MRFNLLPEQERGRGRGRLNALRLAALGAWGVTAVVIVLTSLHVAWTHQVQEEARLLAPRVEAVRAEQARLAAVRRQNAELASDVSELQQFLHAAEHAATLDLLSAVVDAVPKEWWLTRLRLVPGHSVWVEGYADGPQGLTQMLQSLQREPSVRAVELTSMDPVPDWTNPWRQFSAWMTVVNEQP